MELFQELLLTVALSLLGSFILAKLLSMASSCVAAEKKYSVFTSGTDVISIAALYEQKHDNPSVVCGSFESERSVGLVGETVKVEDHEKEEFGVENIANESCESAVISDYGNESDDSKEICREVDIPGLVELKEEESVGVGSEELEENAVDESSERAKCREIEIESRNMVGESPERTKFREIEIGLDEDGASVAKRLEVGVLEGDGAKKGDGGYDEEGWFDDWEGIERTEFEKLFGSAMVFVGSRSNADRISSLDSDVKTELYALHKVAIDGPCGEPQPMALKVSARAKWNAWQRLGNMNREVAMEQYITLLSRSIPGWMGDDTSGGGQQAFQDVGTSENLPSNLRRQPGAENKSKSEKLKPFVEECDVMGVKGPSSIIMDKE